MSKERIDKILSHEGFGSRKEIRRLLRTAAVTVNSSRVQDPGFLLDKNTDLLAIDGKAVELRQNIYLMMNKKKDTVSSTKGGEHQTVFDLLSDNFRTPYLAAKLHIIGRLDIDTEGQLLFTTDGSLTHRLISPKSHISKTYFVVLKNAVLEKERASVSAAFEKGIHIEPQDNAPAADCLPAVVKWIDGEECGRYIKNSSYNKEIAAALLLTIYEGKYHQVKRMFAAVGNTVVYLKRVATGSLLLDETLKPGEYRQLSLEEVEKLI